MPGGGSNALDLQFGEVFGLLKVVTRVESTHDGRTNFICLCTGCGTLVVVRGTDLGRKTNACRSCGRRRAV